MTATLSWNRRILETLFNFCPIKQSKPHPAFQTVDSGGYVIYSPRKEQMNLSLHKNNSIYIAALMTHGVYPLLKLLFSNRVVNIHTGFGVSCFMRLFRKTFFQITFSIFQLAIAQSRQYLCAYQTIASGMLRQVRSFKQKRNVVLCMQWKRPLNSSGK